MISSHSGHGAKPHLQIFYMIYMFYTAKYHPSLPLSTSAPLR